MDWEHGDLTWRVVGLGPGRDTCGHIPPSGVGACGDCGELRVRHTWCASPDCAVCYRYRIEIGRTVRRISERHEAYWKCTTMRNGRPAYRSSHIVVSPPQAWALERMKTTGGLKYMREKLYSFMRNIGFAGGTVVFHPWRVCEWAKQVFAGVDFDGGIWDFLRDRGWLGRESDAIYFAPHWHVLGWGYLLDSAESSTESGGWIYSRVSGPLDPDDLGAVAAYLMTHRGVVLGESRIRMVSQVGCIYGKNLPRDERIIRREAECPCCGEIMCVLDGWVEGEGLDGPGGKTVPEIQRIGIDGEAVGLDLSPFPYICYDRMCTYHIRGAPQYVAIFGHREEVDHDRI